MNQTSVVNQKDKKLLDQSNQQITDLQNEIQRAIRKMSESKPHFNTNKAVPSLARKNEERYHKRRPFMSPSKQQFHHQQGSPIKKSQLSPQS